LKSIATLIVEAGIETGGDTRVSWCPRDCSAATARGQRVIILSTGTKNLQAQLMKRTPFLRSSAAVNLRRRKKAARLSLHGIKKAETRRS